MDSCLLDHHQDNQQSKVELREFLGHHRLTSVELTFVCKVVLVVERRQNEK